MADILATRAGQLRHGWARLITTIATLYLLAFAMKAAAFPLGFWLPASYHTPPDRHRRAVRRPPHQGRRLRADPHARHDLIAGRAPRARPDVIGWVAAWRRIVVPARSPPSPQIRGPPHRSASWSSPASATCSPASPSAPMAGLCRRHRLRTSTRCWR
jgi:hypothetical protein